MSPQIEALKWRKPPKASRTLPLIMRPLLFVALLVCVPLAPTNACLNDRDSDALAVQNTRFPDALRVISGRFERNPPRFYQMRIARVERELKSKPLQFGLYDDLAVAHDKLGDSQSALEIMAQKRALLPAFNAKDKANKEAWYRFFANDGTFRAHRFLKDGAKIEQIGEMKTARTEIKRALDIKPNAHFGREKYQLAVMDWVVATKTQKTNSSLDEFLDNRFRWSWGELENKEVVQGLSGLVVLGAAWESPDVFNALARAMENQRTVALSFLAQKRTEELLREGKHSFNSASLNLEEVAGQEEMLEHRGLNSKNVQTLNALYPQLRTEADAWNARRAQWMNAKFAFGKHPDTDTSFWNGWNNTAPPSLDVAWFNQTKSDNRTNFLSLAGTLLVLFGVPLLLIVWFRRRWAKRNTSLA